MTKSTVISITDQMSKSHRLLEVLLVVAIFAATVWMWACEAENPVVLHLYYVPVVLTGFFRGVYRARLMSLLCILTATTIFLPDVNEAAVFGEPIGYVFAFCLWAATLVLIAILVGTLSDGWRESLSILKKAHDKDVLTDALTGTANRRAFEYELARRRAEWQRDQTPLGLVLLDIDSFKKFNDRYGHQAGDTVLKSVAVALQRSVRDIDLVARYGGEEFGIIMSNASIDEAKDAAERARNLIESSRFPYRGLMLRLTASLGVAQILPGEDVTSLVQRADAALYCSKEAGRNCIHFHDGNTCQRFGQGMAIQQSETQKQNKATADLRDIYTDETTGLPTQKVFLEEFRRRTMEIRRYGGSMSVALVSIDALAQDNTLDKRTQKSLLATIARLAGSVMRESDMIARYDNNSMGVFLPATALEQALLPLQRLSDDAAAYTDLKYPSLKYSVRVGVAEVSVMEPPGLVMQRVEEALASAIEASDDAVCYHDGSDTQLARSIDIAGERL